jgi:hypothetical protein
MKKAIFFTMPGPVSGQFPDSVIFNPIGYAALKQNKTMFGRPYYGIQLTISQEKKLYRK